MADDNRSRPYRSHDPYDRPQGGQAHAPGGDPLVELARLIGQQNDSYSSYGQEPQRLPGRDPRQTADWQRNPDPFRVQPDPLNAPVDPYPAPGHSGYSDGYSDTPLPAAPFDAQHPHPQHYDEQRYADDQYGDPRLAGSQHPQHPQAQYNGQGYDSAPDYNAQQYDPRQYGDPQHGAPQYAAPQYADAHGDQRYGDQPPAYQDQTGAYPQSHGQAPYGQPPYGQDGQNYSDPYYRGAPQGADAHEDHAPRRRGGLVTVLAVLALAVVGTAAAFGYRAVFGTSGTPIPPVIRADSAPAKVVPATQSGDSKPIQDRVGGSQPERIVAREEAPLDLATRAGAPRVVFPGPNPIAPLPTTPLPQNASSLAQATAAPAAAPSSTEPKKIRTVAIRPDQPNPAETASASARASVTPAQSARSASAQPAAIPADNARQQSASAASNTPLSLAPSSSSSARPAPTPTMRTASAPAANGGGYSVQVTSQRSEAEAQSAYRALQAKFPNVLADRQMVIRQADLGEKGTYYRAQVPFGSQSEASEFCSNLKAAGGQCIVQRN